MPERVRKDEGEAGSIYYILYFLVGEISFFHEKVWKFKNVIFVTVMYFLEEVFLFLEALRKKKRLGTEDMSAGKYQ